MSGTGREDYLERLIQGLEAAIPENRERLQYYKPDELQHVYTVKFLAKMEESLAGARLELAELRRARGAGP